jgi:hypothetical protein
LETGAIYGKIRNQSNLIQLMRRSFARERRAPPQQSERRARALLPMNVRGLSARDNSIVTTLNACRTRVQRLREIKTNVLSLAHLHGAKFVLRADG